MLGVSRCLVNFESLVLARIAPSTCVKLLFLKRNKIITRRSFSLNEMFSSLVILSAFIVVRDYTTLFYGVNVFFFCYTYNALYDINVLTRLRKFNKVKLGLTNLDV